MLTIQQARDIIHAAAANAGGLDRLAGVIDEMRRHNQLGNIPLAEECERTIEDMTALYIGGRFVGARKIAEALKITQYNALAPKGA